MRGQSLEGRRRVTFQPYYARNRTPVEACAVFEQRIFRSNRNVAPAERKAAYFTVKFTVYVATLWLIWSSTVSLSV